MRDASDSLGTFLPFLRDTSPDTRRSTSVIGSLGSVGSMIFIFSIFLALSNLAPIPPLDGFCALQVSLEMVLRRELPKRILQPAMIVGMLLLGVLMFRDLVVLALSVFVIVFNVDLEQDAENSREPAALVGQPAGAVLLERPLKLQRTIKEGWKDIEPKAGNRFLGLRFHVEGEKTLVPREYPIEDEEGTHYDPLGVAFGKVGTESYSASTVERIALRHATKGITVQHYTRRGTKGRESRLIGWDLLQPEITLLYEVPEDATQFELQHHSLRHTFKLEAHHDE